LGESRPDRSYVTWKSRISFVKLSLARLAALLTPPAEELDRDLLSETFGLERADRPGRRGHGLHGQPRTDKGCLLLVTCPITGEAA
jgi:hypothetical protein